MAGRITPPLDQQEGLQAALKAIHLDERNPYSHYALAIVSIFSGQLEQAIRAARKAIEISPSFAFGHLGLGMALLFSGRASEAMLLWNRASAEPLRSPELRMVQYPRLRPLFAGRGRSGT